MGVVAGETSQYVCHKYVVVVYVEGPSTEKEEVTSRLNFVRPRDIPASVCQARMNEVQHGVDVLELVIEYSASRKKHLEFD